MSFKLIGSNGLSAFGDLKLWRTDEAVRAQSVDAQAALLPYALAFFAVGLPIFVWAAAYADNAAWALTSLAVFAINWGAFYGLISALRRQPELAANVDRRVRLDILAGLLWSAAIAQMSVFALGAGPAREPLLLLAAGAAIICIFFTAPSLPAILIVGSTAAAPPIIALYADETSREAAGLVWGAVALTGALALVLNRILVRQFALTSELKTLVEAHGQTLAEAEHLSKSKSDLLATLSHEIRNGLTGVVHVLAAAAGAGGRAAPSREQLNAALEATRDLTVTLDATLDSENAEAGALSINTAPFDPAKLAADLVLLNRPQAAAKSLEMTVHVETEIVEAARGAAIADAGRSRQVLANLIANAVKYTLRGRIEVRVRRLGEGKVRFEVADTGPGLSAEEQGLAFQPFTRIERTSAGSPGAGLGLSLATKLARMMGGELSVDSAPGVGSCFSLDLPFDANALAGPDSARDRTSPAALRVLLIEGDGLHAAMMRASLEQLGHQVIHVQKAERITEILKVCDVDLVVAGACGVDAPPPDIVRNVRGSEGRGADASIVAVIEGDAAEAVDCTAAGADMILRRPVTVTGLARVLTDLASHESFKPAAKVAAA